MILVYIPGCFDLLHIGHVAALEQAKRLGDKLAVGVPSDEVVRRDKGEFPAIPLSHRIAMLYSLRCVDMVVPYFEFEFVSSLEMIRPQVLAVGEPWGGANRHIDAELWADRNNCRFERIDRSPEESTTKIKERIRA